MVALRSLSAAAFKAMNAPPPTIAIKIPNAIWRRVSRHDSHNIAVAAVRMSYTTSAIFRPRPTRATNISCSVASRDWTTSPPRSASELRSRSIEPL